MRPAAPRGEASGTARAISTGPPPALGDQAAVESVPAEASLVAVPKASL